MLNGSEEMEREESRNINIEGADTTSGSECDRVADGDGAEEADGVEN